MIRGWTAGGKQSARGLNAIVRRDAGPRLPGASFRFSTDAARAARGVAMKAPTLAIGLLLASCALGACATTGMSDADKLATYRAHAGAPVGSFRYFGRIDGWTPLGDRAVAVWTRPNEAWLLDLAGHCPDIEYTPVIGVTSQFNRVSAKFDKVIARSPGAIEMPCMISEIRPLDAKAIREAEKTARDQPAESSGT
jgi:hypothetical protein